MGRKRTPGLTLRGGVWHIDKYIRGRRICESSGETELEKAEDYLAHRINQIRQAEVFGIRPQRTFEQGAIHYLDRNDHKRSILDDARRLRDVMPYIGHLPIDRVYRDSLDGYVQDCLYKENAAGTVNHGLKVVRQVLNQATEWRDAHGLTWLDRAPKIKLLPDVRKRKPYPLKWTEQDALFSQLPHHLYLMAEFAVNTGCRDAEVCTLHWEWETRYEQLGTSVFVVPGCCTKNGDERLVVLNDVAQRIVEVCRGIHPEFVFTFDGQPVGRMLNSAWLKARTRADLPQVRVHDLRHTFGSRLRNQGVSKEDRQELLGHRADSVTTHYCASELRRLIEVANQATVRSEDDEVVVILRKRVSGF